MHTNRSFEDDVLWIIRQNSEEGPVSRDQLIRWLRAAGWLTDISDRHADRKARDAIQRLRTEHPEGGRIVSTSRSAGYFWAETPEEIEACMAEDESRMRALSAKLRNMRSARDRLNIRPLEQGRLDL
jgi:hypothetical protein